MTHTKEYNRRSFRDREDVKRPFHGRIITQTFTPEYMRELLGIEDADEAVEALREVCRRFETSYNAVADIQEANYHADVLEVVVIPTLNADADAIKRGIQEMHYWLSKEHED